MRRVSLARRLLAEVYATAFMVLVGNSASGQYIFNNGSTTDFQIGWGFAISFAIYSAFDVSGGHINPAISLASWCVGKLRFGELLLYSLAQTVGAAIGALGAYAVYKEALDYHDVGFRTLEGPTGTASFWVSYPNTHVSIFGAFIDQVAGTSFLGMFMALTSRKNCVIPRMAVPLLFGLNALMLGSAFGMNVGCPLNPARDLGPRIVAYFLGYNEIFSHHNYYFWVPLVAPLVGSLVGVYLFKLMVVDASDSDEADDDNDKDSNYKDQTTKYDHVTKELHTVLPTILKKDRRETNGNAITENEFIELLPK